MPGRNDPCFCGSGKKYKKCHGKNRPWPAHENVAAMFRNDTEKKVAVVTKDVLLNQLTRDGPLIARSFDHLAFNDLKEISATFADAIAISWRAQIICAAGDDSLLPTCARLLLNGQETFIASIEVARHGYRRQYGSLARNVVECLSTILCLLTEPNALAALHENTLKSTDTIAAAKRIIPAFGHLYGLLSNHFVHINRLHAAFEPLVRFRQGEESLGFLIPSMRAIAWLIYVVTEIAFFEYAPRPRYWKKLESGAYAYEPSADELAWQRTFLETSYVNGVGQRDTTN